MLEILGLKGILAAVGALAAAGFGIWVQLLRRKAASADAWRARAESVERENAARVDLASGKARIDAETGAGLADLKREADAKKARIDKGRTADESAEDARRMFGGGAGPGAS